MVVLAAAEGAEAVAAGKCHAFHLGRDVSCLVQPLFFHPLYKKTSNSIATNCNPGYLNESR